MQFYQAAALKIDRIFVLTTSIEMYRFLMYYIYNLDIKL